MTKALKPTEMSNAQHANTKISITHRLRTDLGRSDGVTTVIQLVWLTVVRTKPSHSLQQGQNDQQNHRHLQVI